MAAVVACVRGVALAISPQTLVEKLQGNLGLCASAANGGMAESRMRHALRMSSAVASRPFWVKATE